jgi:hypothetical protein
MREYTWLRPAPIRRALLRMESRRFWQVERRSPDRRARLNRCQCEANVGLTVTRTPSQHARWTIHRHGDPTRSGGGLGCPADMADDPSASRAGGSPRATAPLASRAGDPRPCGHGTDQSSDRRPAARDAEHREDTPLVGPSGALECTRGARSCCCLHATRSSGATCLPRWTDPPRRLVRRTDEPARRSLARTGRLRRRGRRRECARGARRCARPG